MLEEEYNANTTKVNGLLSSRSNSPVPPCGESTLYTSSTGTNDSAEELEYDDVEPYYGNKQDDPYSDVRDRMSFLARQDRLRHLTDNGDAYNTASQQLAFIPFFAALTTYLGYAVLITIGHIRDSCASIFRTGRYLASSTKKRPEQEDSPENYSPLLKSWENFYTRRLYHRIQDCFNRPIASNPGATIQVLERVSMDGNKTMQVLGDSKPNTSVRDTYVRGDHVSFVTQFLPPSRDCDEAEMRIARDCLNLGSYNYLGFADDWNATCQNPVLDALHRLPVSCSSSRHEAGTTILHKHLESLVAEFLGKEDAIVYNMGFNTNATTIPALLSKGDLLLSDESNHTSIVNGARASGAFVKTFRHNDACHLEAILKEAIVMGQPRTRRPWNKILVIVEGIYSMEGEYCNLRAISQVCKQYKAYLYLDEAHSIGAMGVTGRGCCEYTGVNTQDIDVLMGTFTKSFGGMGGYIASSNDVISHLRQRCAAAVYHNSLSPVVCQQVITSFEVIMGRDNTDLGKQKLQALKDNANYFRMRLTDMGLHILGNYDSPIIPVMLYNPTKIAAFSRECFKRGLAVVVVGFPAVPILLSRSRFCISAAHTREQLDRALQEIDEIATILKLRYAKSTFG
mmetsp:Transcript_3800/g.5654  ORF Transcript_3800/g.5654 Transcript_3800/m.5654 type:complete len:624 (+) Transcript_3800:130-2001(+)